MTDQRHLKRLAVGWEGQPVDFVTTCIAARRPLLAYAAVHAILLAEWKGLRERPGWAAGRDVIMPDHVHFSMMPLSDRAKPISAGLGNRRSGRRSRS
jgi:putative transposase